MNELGFAIWFFLPAALANVAPILVAPLPGLKRLDGPIDGGRTWRGRRILGDHKTWRGLASGVLLATLILWLQQIAVAHYGWAQAVTGDVDYAGLPTWLLGPLFGIGALGGDALESLVKRQLNKYPGSSWTPFDQLDYVVGGLLASMPVVILSLRQYGLILLFWFGMHFVSSYAGWLLKLKERPI